MAWNNLSPTVFRAIFALACLAFVALRFWGLTGSCLWFDEIFSVHAATHPWNELFSFIALDLIHPPLFYVLLKIWIGVGGQELFWLRLFPVIFSVIAIFPFIALCRELRLTFGTQILALFLFAVNGSLLKYAQEVRMYSLLMCFSLFSMWLFSRYFYRGKSFVPLVLVNVILVYTHYFGWFVVLSEVMAIVIFQRIKMRQILTMAAITFVSFLPWAYLVWSASRTGSGLGQNIGWMTIPGVTSLFRLTLNLIEPLYFQESSAGARSIFPITIPLMLVLVVAAIFYLAKWREQSEDERQRIRLVSLFVSLPLLVAFTASWLLPYSIWGTRHLIFIFVPFIILAAIILSSLPARSLRISAAAIGLALFVSATTIHVTRTTPRYSWCEIGQLTASSSDPQTPLIAVEDLITYHIWFERHGDLQMPGIVRLENVDDVPDDRAYFLPRGFDPIQRVNLSALDLPKFRLVHRANNLSDSEPPLRNLIVKGYRILESRVVEVDSEEVGVYLLER